MNLLCLLNTGKLTLILVGLSGYRLTGRVVVVHGYVIGKQP